MFNFKDRRENDMEELMNPGIIVLAICFGIITVATWAPIYSKKQPADKE